MQDGWESAQPAPGPYIPSNPAPLFRAAAAAPLHTAQEYLETFRGFPSIRKTSFEISRPRVNARRTPLTRHGAPVRMASEETQRRQAEGKNSAPRKNRSWAAVGFPLPAEGGTWNASRSRKLTSPFVRVSATPGTLLLRRHHRDHEGDRGPALGEIGEQAGGGSERPPEFRFSEERP